MQDVPILHNNKDAILDFHVFEIEDFDVLIGHLIEKLLIDTPHLGSLKLSLGGNEFSIPFSRSIHALTDAHPEKESAEEVTVVLPYEPLESLLDHDVPNFIQEEDESGEAFDLLSLEPPPRPLIELKPLPLGLRYAFLHGDKEASVIISDKLSKDGTIRLLAVLEKHRFVLGYSLQDLKGISPALYTHCIPIEPESMPSRGPRDG